MRTVSIFLTGAVILLGQESQRTFQFRQLQTAPQFAEAATIIRSIAEIRDLTVDANTKTMTIRGNQGQAALAEWLFNKIDRLVGSGPIPDAPQLDYRLALDKDDMVRIFYLKTALAPAVSQEAAVITRSLIEIRRFLVSNAAGAFVVRGTREQMDAARWLVEALDRQSFAGAANEYRITGSAGEDTIRLFLVSKFGSAKELQNFAVDMRQATQIRRVFVYNPLRVIAVRSTPAQVKQAESIVNKL